ncbi:MAG: glycosyltransferase family protein [Planctomycetota bacterium]
MSPRTTTASIGPWRASSPLRVLTYSHDSCGLGHLRRSVTIAEAITEQEPNAEIVCVSGSPVPEMFPLPPRTELLKLPSISKDDGGNYRSRHLPLSFGELAQLRSDLITAAIRAFRPDLVVVDHTAAGPGQELLPALEVLRREQPGTRVALGLRDILDAPARARVEFAQTRAFDRIRQHYDMVLVYGQREVFDVAVEYAMPADIAARIQYVGAVVPEAALAARAERRADRSCPHLVFTAGGGEDGSRLLRDAATALRGPMRDERLRATFVTGPLAPKDDCERLHMMLCADARCRVERSVQDLPHLLADADLVVGMGGYNTVYETLALGVPMLAVPRRGPRLEQFERCRRLAAGGHLLVLTPDSAGDPDKLAESIAAARASRTLHRPLSFGGARRAAELLLAAVHAGRSAIALAP